MRRKNLIPLIFAALGYTAAAQEKPNVVFIAIDDLNDWVGCLQGHPQAKTPNIDRLANQGMLFTNAHCQAPICGPSRAAIMTGLFPSTSGNYFQLNDQDIKKSNEITAKAIFLPDYFEQNGYKTLGVGKLFHNGDNAHVFDEYGGIFDKYGPKPEKRMKYDPRWFSEKKGDTQTDWGPYPDNDSLMPDFKSAEWAVKQLRQVQEKPFFLAVGFIRPHVPLHVPEKWFKQFPRNEMITPPYRADDYDDIPEMGKRVSEAPMMPTTEWMIETDQWKDFVQAYLACIAFVDAQVGKVLEALEKSSYSQNTIVVLWSDHGYHIGEKNRFAKQAIWERDTRTPLIIKVPGQAPGKCKAPAQLIDMYPTLLELCGMEPYSLADGHSLAPLVKHPGQKWDYNAISHYGIGNVTVRDYRYRLIQYEDGSQEFYDMKKDPNEWTNLAGKKKYSKRIQSMQKSVPVDWAPISTHVNYNFNDYFEQRYNGE